MNKELEILLYGIATGFTFVGLMGFAIVNTPLPGFILISIGATVAFITKRYDE
jgi:hypothetical protein